MVATMRFGPQTVGLEQGTVATVQIQFIHSQEQCQMLCEKINDSVRCAGSRPTVWGLGIVGATLLHVQAMAGGVPLSCEITAGPSEAPCGSSGNLLGSIVTGGEGPYTYDWNLGTADPGWALEGPDNGDSVAYTAGPPNGATGTGADITLLVYDNNGTLTTCSIHLRCSPTSLSCDIEFNGSNPICGSAGNELSVSVNGGAGPFTYAWTMTQGDPGWMIDSGAATDTISYSAGSGPSGADFKCVVNDANGASTECTIHLRCDVGQGEGCTPGYWKQSQHFSDWTAPYVPGMLFKDACANAHCFENAFPGKTLLQVLEQGGGGLKALGRHTVAALLNGASDINFGLSAQSVIDQFNAVHPGGDYETLKNTFAGLNEQGCPLNGHSDLDNDGIVNTNDLLMVINHWNTPGPGDITQDGIVNVNDLMAVINNWG